MQDVSSKIPQGAKDFASQTKERFFRSDQLRSFSVFFGTGETQAFSLDCSPGVLCGRLRHNVLFFYLNYIGIMAVIFILTALLTIISPSTLFTIGVLAIGWLLVIRATKGGELTIKGFSISRKTITLIMMIISGLTCFYLLADVFWMALAPAVCVSTIHAVMRDASEHVIDNSKALTIELIDNDIEN